MALIKNINIKGYNYEYWMLSNVSANKVKDVTNCTLCLYKNKEERNKNINSNILQTNIIVQGYITDIPQIYNSIKQSFSEFDNIEEIESIPTIIKFFSDVEDEI